jgi:hypothetical protein
VHIVKFARVLGTAGALLMLAVPAVAQNIGADPFAMFAKHIAARLEATTEAGWLYCFYLQGHDNVLVKMFPNALHEDPVIHGGPRISMPGPFYQFNFDIAEPTGWT